MGVVLLLTGAGVVSAQEESDTTFRFNSYVQGSGTITPTGIDNFEEVACEEGAMSAATFTEGLMILEVQMETISVRDTLALVSLDQSGMFMIAYDKNGARYKVAMVTSPFKALIIEREEVLTILLDDYPCN